MRYNLISRPSDPKIVGMKNGESQGWIIPKKYNKYSDYQEMYDFFVNSYWDKSDFNPPKIFNIEYVKLNKKAKLTDIFYIAPSFIGCDIAINSKVFGLISNLELRNSFFFPINLYDHSGLKINDTFYLVYTKMIGYEYIDFSNSTFFTGSEILGKRYIGIKDEQHFLNVLNENALIKAEKIKLNDRFEHMDYFTTRLGGPFISEKLLDRFNDFEISGFKLSNRKEIVNE